METPTESNANLDIIEETILDPWSMQEGSMILKHTLVFIPMLPMLSLFLAAGRQ